ncbi:uncharacterized protein LOC143449882 [Clavelina lepadiformis]|uniref:uncharacterized protein LOC143449882 n=1 Tax=Clavelina lepadiformis TaxID=159417 RepID=UPI004041977B
MSKLQSEMPLVHKQFMEGHHVVRRTNRCWAGLWTELTIEQCLMKSLKSRGGLTRGRGLTETQRLIWVLSAPACAQVNETMQEFTGVKFLTSEQHKESTPARMSRDMKDIQDLIQYLTVRNPFRKDGPPSLRSIVIGIAARDSVNCDSAWDVGMKILALMPGIKVTEHSFRKKHQAITMGAKESVKVKDREVSVDPILLIQRLVCAGTTTNQLPEVFQYELCQFSSALFESKSIITPANKASLADFLWSSSIESAPKPSKPLVDHVLYGGALLHKLRWTKGACMG